MCGNEQKDIKNRIKKDNKKMKKNSSFLSLYERLLKTFLIKYDTIYLYSM